MSDSQKKQRTGATPIKNPLLSASVTGLTFDDFPNKPLLLPAAPPIVHGTIPAPVVNSSGLLARDHKSLVTVGSSSLDTESLDEINLNTSNEDNQTADLNANPLLEQSSQGVNSDSILSQAASSFSALPSVASNVFSTFSKRITAISSRETTPSNDQNQQDLNSNPLTPGLEIQPSYTQQQQIPHQGNLPQAPSTFYAPPKGDDYYSGTFNASNAQYRETPANLPPVEPPKFYTPTDVLAIPSVTAPPTDNLGGQNNFRFSSKKKLYAPIPGLSDQSQKPTTIVDSSAVNAPISYDLSYGNNSYQTAPYPTSEDRQTDDRKGNSGLFSRISNLAPSGVLQNITGLVQSATGSLTQTNKTDSFQSATAPAIDEENYYFAGPPPPTNYFVPPSLSGQQTNPETNLNTQPSLYSGQQTQSSSLAQPTNFFNTQPVKQDSIDITNKAIGSAPKSETPIIFFNPSNVPPQINPNPSVQLSNIKSSNLPSESKEEPGATFVTTSNQSFLNETALTTGPQVNFFDHNKYLPSTNQTSSFATPHPLSPTTDPKIPPTSSGPTSYRLQKGTKLYKNPLTPQETAPIHVTPSEIQAGNQFMQTHATLPPPSFTTFESVPLFAPPTVYEVNINTLSSFTPPPVSDLISNKSTQSVALFSPTVEQLKSVETLQNPSLFVPSVDEHLENLKLEELAPPTKKHKSNESESNDASSLAQVQKNNLDETNANKTERYIIQESPEIQFGTQTPEQNINYFFADNKEVLSNDEPTEQDIEKIHFKIQEDKIDDHIEETLKKLSLNAETSSETVQLPPISTLSCVIANNPYRRSSTTETVKPATSQPILANFFTPGPASGSDSLNFFGTLPAAESSFETSSGEVNFFSQSDQEKKEPGNSFLTTSVHQAHLDSSDLVVKADLTPLQPNTVVHPPLSAFFPDIPTSFCEISNIQEDKKDITKHLNELSIQGNVPPPIGFESFLADIKTVKEEKTTEQDKNTTVVQEIRKQTEQPEVVNRFSNYFNQANEQPEVTKDPSAFFDSIPVQPQQQQQQQIEVIAPGAAANEEQRIQYFFNNPPPKEASTVGDLNYDLVHSGLAIKNLHQRSLTPISNLVEPPSSTCSEFSEINSSIAGQKPTVPNLSISENSCKSNEKDNKKNTNNNSSLEQDSLAEDSPIEYHEELPEELRMANILSADKLTTPSEASVSYKPAIKHWFFKRTIGDKPVWVPFSHFDSALLETTLSMEADDKPNIVAVEGGRYDVNISERKKMSVYWESTPIEVRRCSWFYKAVDSKYVPYEEQTADVLENEYKQAAESGVWHKTIILGMGEQVVLHGPTVIVHFQQQQNADAWGGNTQTSTRPRVVKRDLDDFNIEQGESQKVDHLLFMVHGIGSACDLKLRPVEEVVEDFRTIARQLVQSHYKNSTDLGLVGRVEVLPISWHSHLHSVEMGIDDKLRMITLESIPKLRNFTNDTLLDILFYTSPTYCQKIMNTIVQSLNNLYLKYRERHPDFNGGVSLAGHSLGSLILFDLLCHQNPIKETEDKNLENPDQFLTPNSSFGKHMDSNQLEDNQMSYTMGPAGTGQPFISYGQLIFQPKKFFALGSPIGMFATIRGIDKLGLDFRLPTCPGFYNIFHPYDPVAYRIEALVNPDLSGLRPVLIPHHKGRKRMHLELKETMTRVSMDLKNRFLDKFKTTLDSVNIFGSTSKSSKEAEELMEKEVDKVIQMQMQLEQQNPNSHDNLPSGSDCQNSATATPRQRSDSISTAMSDDIVEIDFPLGKLNDSKRIDYVLQEAPLEFINEYIFALSSHVCYWDSEDTILFVMKEIYAGLGVSPDSQVPQQTLSIERPSSCNS